MTPEDPRGLVVFPAAPDAASHHNEWWLVPLAILLAAAMIAVAFAVR